MRLVGLYFDREAGRRRSRDQEREGRNRKCEADEPDIPQRRPDLEHARRCRVTGQQRHPVVERDELAQEIKALRNMSVHRDWTTVGPSSRKDADCLWQTLVHPAQAFAHPSDVVDDPVLTVDEKRAILASWASDACAVEAAPGLRRPPGTRQPMSVDDILE